MLLMLLAVAAVSAVVAYLNQRFPKDALAILLIVGLNALLGYLQESKAQNALQSLRRMASPWSRSAVTAAGIGSQASSWCPVIASGWRRGPGARRWAGARGS